MQKIHALFIDIDGTLLDSRQRITPAVHDALLAFQKAGGVVVLSSARPYAGMRQYGEALHLAQYGGYYAAFNGGQLVDAATLSAIFAQAFSPEDAALVVQAVHQLEQETQQAALEGSSGGPLTLEKAWQIHDLIDKTSLNLMTYQGDRLIVQRLEPYAAAEMLVNQLQLQVRPDFAAALEVAPVKFLVSGDPALIRTLYPRLKERLPGCEVVVSDPFFVEITPPGVHKGQALETIAARLGIPIEAIAAIGDSENDLPMIRRAGLGVAMANAPESVRQAADFVTRSNDEDGVAYFLDSFGSS
ncbi:MAG TPA: Cof-type HAD-IIB family hydrolase [Candidatus Faecalibacterium gallistercoris]|uniref:Cof-type HAD-IIB family hydrolase n=1 Tax=Candidatus Faecalibacterium gallistercoris TaxID=2838579 RepID=A0A9D2FGE4_9FIRM|nr:Cof-type HAD-IIB family hydrolase [Candidatus Faecalibacterium gallistercoris]